MAKAKSSAGALGNILEFLAWLTGIIVSLAVAFGMINGILSIQWIPGGVVEFFGWVVVITTLIGIVLVIARQFE